MNNVVQADKERSPLFQGQESLSWLSAFKQSWKSALHPDLSQITVQQAIPSTIGFLLPLTIGVATGQVLAGVSIAGGALGIGSVGLTYTYRARIRTMFLACIAVAISAFVGAITSHLGFLAILILGVWGFGAGLLASLGQPALIIGLQAVVALIILSHFALSPLQAALQALLFFTGGVFQIVLALLFAPLQRTTIEREALTAAFQQLADYAISQDRESSGEQLRDALMKAQTILADSNDQSQQGSILFALLEEAEKMRLIFIVLRTLRQSLAKENTKQTQHEVCMKQLLQSAADELRQMASELKSAGKPIGHANADEAMKAALMTLRQQQVDTARDEALQQELLAYCDRLRDHLHRAGKLAKSWKYPQQAISIPVKPPYLASLHLHSMQATLQDNVTLRSPALRHAIRLGITLALAAILYRTILQQPAERGYWIVLTALLVLRPDFSTTLTRGIARMLGTLIGAVLTTVLISQLAPSHIALVIVDAIFGFLAFSFLFVNYALYSVFVTIEVVILLAFVSAPLPETATYRAVNTVIGGILALAIFFLWPTWERAQVPTYIATRLEALANYLSIVMEAYAHPRAYNQAAIDNIHREVRLARSNVEASVQHALQEPGRYSLNAEIARGLLGAADNLAQNIIALEAYLLGNPEHPAFPAAQPFAEKLHTALHLLAQAVREQRPVKESGVNLQEELHILKHAKAPERRQQKTFGVEQRFVVGEVKQIVQAIHTLYQLLSKSANT
jgi:uncharacterized membrane protein YccC